MATGVAFGRPVSMIFQPGAYTEVDASALNIVAAFSRNTVCVFGAALGGEPGKVYKFNDPIQAQRLFGIGSPLADAITFAFRGGTQGGAPLVIGVRADAAGQASGTLTSNGTTLAAKMKDFGGYGNTWGVKIGAGYVEVTGLNLDGTEYYQKVSEPVLSALVDRVNTETPVSLEITAGGTKASQDLLLSTSQLDGTATIEKEDTTVLTSDAYLYQYPANFLQDAQTSFTASFDEAVTGETTTTIGNATISSALPAELEGVYECTGVYEGGAAVLLATDIELTKTAYGADIYRMRLPSATWGVGVARIGQVFAIANTPAGDYDGTYQVVHYEHDGDTPTTGGTVRVVKRITDGTLAEGTFQSAAGLLFQSLLQFARVQPPTIALETQLPANGNLYRGGQYLTVTLQIPDDGITLSTYYSTVQGDTIATVGSKIAQQINADPEWQPYATAAAVYNGGTFTSTLTITAKSPGTLANTYPVNILVNVQATLLVTASDVTLTGGVEAPQPNGTIPFASGYDSAPTYQSVIDNLELLADEPLRYIVAAGITDIGAQAAIADHVKLSSSTAKRRERIAILGHGLGWTKAQVIERAQFFNSERVVFCAGGLETPDLKTGAPRMYPSSICTTAIVAGMLAAEGNAVSDPITHTFLVNVSGTEIEYKSGSLDTDDAIKAGVVVIEKDPTLVRESRGYRVVRGITTRRDSAVFEQISIINQSDYTAQVIRDMQETLFIGQALLPSTLELIKTHVNLELNKLVTQKIIFGYDAGFTTAKLNPSSRSAVDVVYKFYPAPAIDFILNVQLLFPVPESEAVA